jgi:hypothetical protein
MATMVDFGDACWSTHVPESPRSADPPLVHSKEWGSSGQPHEVACEPSLQSVLRQRQVVTDRLKVRFQNREFLPMNVCPSGRRTCTLWRVPGAPSGPVSMSKPTDPISLSNPLRGCALHLQSPDAIKARLMGLRRNSTELNSTRFVEPTEWSALASSFKVWKADALLTDKRFLLRRSDESSRPLNFTSRSGFGGWLGDYQRGASATLPGTCAARCYPSKRRWEFLMPPSDRAVSGPPHARKGRHLSR